MKAKDRKLVHGAFVAAKGLLCTGYERKETFICFSIGDARRLRLCTLAAEHLAVDIVMSRLGNDPDITAEGWLRQSVGKSAINKAGGRKAVQEWRHRWLDSLIEEFSK